MVFRTQSANKKTADGSVFSAKNILSITDKIKKMGNKNVFVIILIIGILLMTIPGSFNKSELKPESVGEEEKLKHILEKIDGCGKVWVMITYTESQSYQNTYSGAKGAVIVAEGADIPEISGKISDAVQAALDLPAHKVKVYKSKIGKDD